MIQTHIILVLGTPLYLPRLELCCSLNIRQELGLGLKRNCSLVPKLLCTLESPGEILTLLHPIPIKSEHLGVAVGQQ